MPSPCRELFHGLNRTTYQGCRPSVTFSVALVVANSSAPDCCSHASSVVCCSFKLKPPTTTYSTCCRICSGGSVRKNCSTRRSPNGRHNEMIRVVLGADEADGFDFRRQQRADAGQRVGAAGINRINFQRAGNLALVGMLRRATWIKWFWPATADGPATKSKRQRPESKRRRPARATSGGG